MLSTDNFRDWYAVVKQILQCLVLEASISSERELLQNPLRDVQRMQISIDWKSHL